MIFQSNHYPDEFSNQSELDEFIYDFDPNAKVDFNDKDAVVGFFSELAGDWLVDFDQGIYFVTEISKVHRYRGCPECLEYTDVITDGLGYFHCCRKCGKLWKGNQVRGIK